MKSCTLAALLLTVLPIAARAQQADGGISEQAMREIRTGYQNTPADRAVRNALAATDLKQLIVNQENLPAYDTHFNIRVKSEGITNQKSSNRCWLFSGLNVLRAEMMRKHDMPKFEFSQVYNFFYDQLEKSNHFLQNVIDYRKEPITSRMNQWLFMNPIGDGGQFTGVADLIAKYGAVPIEIMPETFNSGKTAQMGALISTKLREYGLKLREAKEKDLAQIKTACLKDIYRILALTLGEPPTEFEWTQRDKKGNAVLTRTFTPRSFYEHYVGRDLNDEYLMFLNDPSHEYYKVYEVELERHAYDGHNWRYVNLPMDELRKMSLASLRDSTMVYFSCDVGKQRLADKGWLDTRALDYESLLGVSFPMDKAQRIASCDSGSAHAMVLAGADVAEDGKPRKWLVENSWGETGYKGFLIMSDEWFAEYLFRLVLERKYVPEEIVKLFDGPTVKLPAWNPMFAQEE